MIIIQNIKSIYVDGGKNYNFFDENLCKKIDKDSKCMDKCLNEEFENKFYNNQYSIFYHNCRDWAEDTYSSCKNKCEEANYYDSYNYIDWYIPELPYNNYKFYPELGKKYYK